MPFLRQAMLVIVDEANDIQFSDMEAKMTDMVAEIKDLHKEFQQFKWYGRSHQAVNLNHLEGQH